MKPRMSQKEDTLKSMWPLWDFPMTFLRPVYTMNLEWKLVWNPKKSNKDVYIQKGGKKRTHNGVSFTSKTMAFISNRPHSRTSLACCSDETDMDNDLHQLFSSLSLSLSLWGIHLPAVWINSSYVTTYTTFKHVQLQYYWYCNFSY